jgi:hypothetical protein
MAELQIGAKYLVYLAAHFFSVARGCVELRYSGLSAFAIVGVSNGAAYANRV